MSRTTLLLASIGACLIAVGLLSATGAAASQLAQETPDQERLVVFELFNRSASGG